MQEQKDSIIDDDVTEINNLESFVKMGVEFIS